MEGRNTREEETLDEVVIQDDREDPSNDDGEVLVERGNTRDIFVETYSTCHLETSTIQ